MTNKANKGFVFSAYDKFFRFLLMDNHLFLSIYIGILSFKGCLLYTSDAADE